MVKIMLVIPDYFHPIVRILMMWEIFMLDLFKNILNILNLSTG